MNTSGKLFAKASVSKINAIIGRSGHLRKPSVIQLPINDICNSRCVMCYIHERKRETEITPAQIAQIVSDPIFSEIRHVGISGGEPTLRTDLNAIVENLIVTLSSLRSISIISNALRPELTLKTLRQLNETIRSQGLQFNANISLDGIGELHDANRGIPGNFEAAVSVIDGLIESDIDLTIGCTLTPVNCYGADDVLLWARSRNILNREFRIGVPIKRLYNVGRKDFPQFDPQQTFHLHEFFKKLSYEEPVPLEKKIFYKGLAGQLVGSSHRLIGCDWQTRGITLDSKGGISYCSVQSPILGSALERPAGELYSNNRHVLQQIIRDHCSSCQHDLSGPAPAGILLDSAVQEITRPAARVSNRLSAEYSAWRLDKQRTQLRRRSRPADWKNVLITGWYGTETAGDKAILGEILHFIQVNSLDCKINVTTLDMDVSRQTLFEMTADGSYGILPIEDCLLKDDVAAYDAVIIGGGPLEEQADLKLLAQIFSNAAKLGKDCVIFGCGVGPLVSQKARRFTRSIIAAAHTGFLRDEDSISLASELVPDHNLTLGCDPALAYIKRKKSAFAQVPGPNADGLSIVALLRANTPEYVSGHALQNLGTENSELAKHAAELFDFAVSEHDASVVLLPMHTLYRGGDDRMFARSVAVVAKSSGQITFDPRYLTIDQLLNRISEAKVILAMRYHAHLFALALGIPFISIDYTGKSGKVRNLVRRLGVENWSMEWNRLSPYDAERKLSRMVADHSMVREHLSDGLQAMLKSLTDAYTTSFELGSVSTAVEVDAIDQGQ